MEETNNTKTEVTVDKNRLKVALVIGGVLLVGARIISKRAYYRGFKDCAAEMVVATLPKTK